MSTSSELRQLIDTLSADAAWYRYFTQGERWKPKGRPFVQIDSMDREWRLNCVRFMERRAAFYAAKYADGCGVEAWQASQLLNGEMALSIVEATLEAEAHAALADPDAWIRQTALYRSMAAGLPVKGKKLRALEARARHWDHCPARQVPPRTCVCVRDDIED